MAATAYVVNYNADNNLAAFHFAHPDLRIQAARAEFEAAGRSFRAGSFIVPTQGSPAELGALLREAGASSPDIRGGLELEGVRNLQRFVEEGGTFVTLTNSSHLLVHFRIAQGVSIREPQNLWAPGGVFRTTRTDDRSPLAYGYDEELGVYFNRNQSPLLTSPRRAAATGGRRACRGGGTSMARTSRPAAPDSDSDQQASDDVRTVFRFHEDPAQLLISGGLTNGDELIGAPALVDARVGEGHVVMFSFNPFWRGGTLGSYGLDFNALLHHGNLDVGTAVAEDRQDR